MRQERLCRGEFGALVPDRVQATVDRRRASPLAAMKNLADLRQTQPRGSAGQHDAQPLHMLVAVVAMPGGCAIRNNDTLVLPMAQHMRRNAEPAGSLSDPHIPIVAP